MRAWEHRGNDEGDYTGGLATARLSSMALATHDYLPSNNSIDLTMIDTDELQPDLPARDIAVDGKDDDFAESKVARSRRNNETDELVYTKGRRKADKHRMTTEQRRTPDSA